MDIKENFFPNQSILLMPSKIMRQNYFQSQLLDEIKPQDLNVNVDKEKNKFLKGLEDILICCICYNYLENPVNDPVCPHYGCKKCLEQYFKVNKRNILPCPICRRIIRKKNLVKIPLFESLKEILKDAQNIQLSFENNVNIDDKCDSHPKNAVFDICLDCKIKMCPICIEERNKHMNHHLVNYERYIKLFYFFQENFLKIKETIVEEENNIKQLKKTNELLEKEKRGYLNFFNEISIRINQFYSENQKNISKTIAESMKMIARLRNFMTNLKTHVSSQFKESYNDLDNIQEIENEIKERISKINLKSNQDNFLNYGDAIDKDLYLFNKKFSFAANKKSLLDYKNLRYKINNYYSFGIDLSEDKKMITLYLDVENKINNKPNISSYKPKIEFKNKITYLEPEEIDQQLYSYEISIPIEEMFNQNEDNVYVNLDLLTLTLRDKE